jgi:plastocyanin
MLSHSIALMLMTILINASMVVVAPAGAQQQGDPQAESEEGLTTTLKGDSLTAGDIITVSAATTTTTGGTTGDNNSASNANTINVTAINQSIVEAITYTEQAYVAIQNNDTRSVLRNLNFSLNALENIQGNLTLTTPEGSSNSSSTSGIDNNIAAGTTTEPVTDNGSSNSNDAAANTSISIVSDASILTDSAFQPNPMNVSILSTVTWANHDLVPHTVTSGENGQADGKFDSSIMGPEETFNFTFTEAGNYLYFCMLHPNMVGIVRVS